MPRAAAAARGLRGHLGPPRRARVARGLVGPAARDRGRRGRVIGAPRHRRDAAQRVDPAIRGPPCLPSEDGGTRRLRGVRFPSGATSARRNARAPTSAPCPAPRHHGPAGGLPGGDRRDDAAGAVVARGLPQRLRAGRGGDHAPRARARRVGRGGPLSVRGHAARGRHRLGRRLRGGRVPSSGSAAGQAPRPSTWRPVIIPA